MLDIQNVRKTFNKNTINEKKALNGINLHLDEGDFVTVIGGKNTEAYKDRALRSRVFRDIYEELHRQFGVVNYKAIKRKDMESVRDIIGEYSLPLALLNEVNMTNAQACISGC